MSLAIAEHGGILVVDSRLIAKELWIEHEVFLRTLKKHQAKIEERFGIIRFENGKIGGRGRPEKYALLTEPQATILMTFSRNTEQVVDCKLRLVEAFEKAKQVIKKVIPQQQATISDLDKQIEILKLQNENLNATLQLRHLDNNMLTMHGAELVLTLRGKADQLVRVEQTVTEVVNPKTQSSERILTAEQLKKIVKQNTGQTIPSMKWFTDKLREKGRDDLLVPVTRHQISEYVTPETLAEGISLVFGENRQLLLGE